MPLKINEEKTPSQNAQNGGFFGSWSWKVHKIAKLVQSQNVLVKCNEHGYIARSINS
jgi:hypothetical protein